MSPWLRIGCGVKKERMKEVRNRIVSYWDLICALILFWWLCNTESHLIGRFTPICSVSNVPPRSLNSSVTAFLLLH